eukprot:COSAG02_NODE_2419_length_8904_cov_11.259171_4_plen_66_part_00
MKIRVGYSRIWMSFIYNLTDFHEVFPVFPTEPCVLRTFGHDKKLNTCAQSVPKKFRDRLRADKNQ